MCVRGRVVTLPRLSHARVGAYRRALPRRNSTTGRAPGGVSEGTPWFDADLRALHGLTLIYYEQNDYKHIDIHTYGAPSRSGGPNGSLSETGRMDPTGRQKQAEARG